MKDCIFCKIIKGEIPAGKGKIWEDENFLAFLDINPIAEGHTLIIPKQHFETLKDINDEISKEFISTIQKVGIILMEKYNCDGFNILLNNGESAGQVINHLHFHILPRKKGDNKKGFSLG